MSTAANPVLSSQYPEDILNAARQQWAQLPDVSRRSFLKIAGVAGGGLAIGFTLVPKGLAQESAGLVELNAYVRISPEGKIYIYNKNPEVGQGIKTALPMIIAEELDAAWPDVVVEQSPIDGRLYGAQFAGGSLSIPMNWDAMRQAGATARAMLVAAAAEQWGVDAADLRTADSRVIKPSGESLSYGELANAAAKMSVPDVKSLKLKERNEYKLLGKRVTGVDNHKLVTGQPLFGIDQRHPNMSYAVYEKCPAVGGKVKNANLDEIKTLKGVKDAFVLEGTGLPTEVMPGVAIIADSTWSAFQAKKRLKVEWDLSEASTDSWSELQKQAMELAKTSGSESLRNDGDVDAAMASAAKTIESVYTYHFVHHANLEPQNCTAHFKDGAIELWAPSQTPGSAVPLVAKVVGIPADKVTLNQLRIGGGFGRRLMNDYVCEVAAIAQRVDGPVKLQWTREDDMAHDFYRPGAFHSLKGAVSADGKLAAWQNHFISFTADGKRPASGADLPATEFPALAIENYRATQTLLPLQTPTGPWRAPGSNTRAWVMQSFIHELAVAAGRDHRDFLIELMGEPRLLGGSPRGGALNTGRAVDVIKLATEKAGWGKQLPAGRALGLAFYYSHQGHVAEVAEVSVDANKKVTVHKVVVAADVGPIVNLSGAENQMEGAAVDGVSTMMGLDITMENGAIEQSNFHQYPILRMAKAPKVETYFLQSDNSPTGLGEPGFPPLAPAVCNAIFAATGHRVKTLPISREGFTV